MREMKQGVDPKESRKKDTNPFCIEIPLIAVQLFFQR
jgi:hypothetical protein